MCVILVMLRVCVCVWVCSVVSANQIVQECLDMPVSVYVGVSVSVSAYVYV